MVSGSEIQVWQNYSESGGSYVCICPRYRDDPVFTFEQEKALYEIAKGFLLANRQAARRKRYADKKKKQKGGG